MFQIGLHQIKELYLFACEAKVVSICFCDGSVWQLIVSTCLSTDILDLVITSFNNVSTQEGF